jgi:hypothetical protein
VSGPLKSFQVVDARHPDEFAAALGRLVGRVWLEPTARNQKFHCRLAHIPLGDVGILHGEYDTGFKARLSDFSNFVGSTGPLKGAGAHVIGRREVTVSKGHGIILSPGDVTLYYGPQFKHLSM